MKNALTFIALRSAAGVAAAHAGTAAAHQGHGLPGDSHWHASDAWGFVMVAAVAVVAIWWHNRK